MIPMPTHQRKLACVIEDDTTLATGYAIALDEAGFDTKIFHEGPPLLNLLRSTVPSLILLDLNLPHISGEKILTRIRDDERLDETKVVIISADSTWASHLEGRANMVLIKPVGFRLLRELASRLHG